MKQCIRYDSFESIIFMVWKYTFMTIITVEQYYFKYFIFFFFSSRRRHTRWNCDWSSDVCSSDLRGEGGEQDGDRYDDEGDERRHTGSVHRELVSADPVGNRIGDERAGDHSDD